MSVWCGTRQTSAQRAAVQEARTGYLAGFARARSAAGATCTVAIAHDWPGTYARQGLERT